MVGHNASQASTRLTRLVRSWASDNRGAMAIIYGLMAVPLLGFVGVAVDYARMHSGRVEMQNALDSAALAGGRAYENTSGTFSVRETAAKTAAQNFFKANMPDNVHGMTEPTISVTPTAQQVVVTASADMPTAFMQLLGIEAMTVSASSTVVRNGRGVELVLVMDNTGSMRSNLSGSSVSMMESMKSSAKKLVDILYGDRETIENFYISLVPYAAMVNIGNTHTDWVQAPGGGTWNSAANSTYFAGTTWKGCVMARPDPYDETDDTPSTKKWEVMSWPSTKNVTYKDKNNTLMQVKKNGTWSPIKGDNDWPSINEANSAQNNGTGPNLGCPPPIMPLQQSKAAAIAAINNMQPWHRGGTMSNLGLAWGWRALSPEWRGLWGGDTPAEYPLDYNTENWDKVLILLTDGVNEWFDWEGNGTKGDDGKTPVNGLPGKAGFSTSSSAYVVQGNVPDNTDYGAYGRIAENRLGTTSNSQAQTVLNNKMKRMCTKLRDNGVTLYTITFGSPNAATKQTFLECAGRPDQYFDTPSNDELEAAFIAIATEINNLRIAQ
ncbi:TadE/TadG family type IV pilus assembly protein [Iodidimonas sp. SYSU 1G8]|uniref:TadE/TadG family type IV pilus assembly protein n=1 Tax=Iodidimonas sp. SYSU 1G8 TaxID=3133967 RepID=UPI0031FE70CE